MRRALADHPVLAGATLATVLLGVCWGLLNEFNRHRGWLESTAVGATNGVIGGVIAGVVIYLYDRRLFGGRTPTPAERAAVATALRQLSPPDDPRLLAASLRIARAWARPGSSPRVVLGLMSVLMVAGVVLGVLGQWEGWLDAGFLLVLGPWAVRKTARLQARARRYLALFP